MSVSLANETTRRRNRVCPSLLPIYIPTLLAVGIGHFHTSRASSRLTSRRCTCKKIRKQHGPITCFTPRRALTSTRLPTRQENQKLKKQLARERHAIPCLSRARMSHGRQWETHQQGCRQLNKTQQRTLVMQVNHAHPRARNGLSQNGEGTRATRPCLQASRTTVSPFLM